MDRRRFMPATEGLEKREVLSGVTAQANVNQPPQDVPVTFLQKELRIANLPFFLKQFQPGRTLPTATITKLQDDLLSIAGRLHRPNPATLEAFNDTLRDVIPNASLSTNNAKELSHAFRVVVSDTGATPQQVAALTEDMNQLAKVDSESSQPVFLATNDYSTVLQTILGVGRPIQTPPNPQIALTNGVRISSRVGKTTNHTPTLVGVYGAGASAGTFAGNTGGGFNSNGVTIQILDDQGNILGQGPVGAQNGDYRITLTTPLDDGVHRLHSRAVDAQGHMSDPSPVYMLQVVTRPTIAVTGRSTPRGPLAGR
jgi:hypothetical protein